MSGTTLILLSGFLGAGKTTVMLSMAEYLRKNNVKTACITNDQGEQLVDSRMVMKNNIPLLQVQGGCFCCRFDELVQSVNRLMENYEPDVIIAEAVGSCTDLVATVIKPLISFHGNKLDIRPLTSIVDPNRLSEFLSDCSRFSKEVQYLFEKQLEEARYILLNKIDLLKSEEKEELIYRIQTKFPDADVLEQSALTGVGMNNLLDKLLSYRQDELPTITVDYDLYAEAEAQLGWLNAAFTWYGDIENVGAVSTAFIDNIVKDLEQLHAETAHVKLWAQDSKHSLKLSAIRNQGLISLDYSTAPQWSATSLTVWLNARVNIEFSQLRNIYFHALSTIMHDYRLDVVYDRMECFAPSRPVPTYRLA